MADAWYLNVPAEVGRYASLASPILNDSIGKIVIDIQLTGSSFPIANRVLTGGQSRNNRIRIADANTFQMSNGGNDYNYTLLTPATNRSVFEAVKVGGRWDLYQDSVLVSGIILPGPGDINFLFPSGDNVVETTSANVYKIEFYDTSGVLIHQYLNTIDGTQTVFTDTIGGNNATLNSFSSPPPWVLYDDGGGGGALEIDPPLVGATAVVPSLEVSVSPALDIPVISSEAVVFESEFLTGLPLEVPRVQGTPFVYEFSILESGEVVLEVVGSETDVFSYEIIGQQVIDIGETGGIPEVYTFTLVKPQQIQVDRTDGTTNVLTFVVSDQNGIVIPLEDRETLNRVAAFLRTAGFEGTTNEVILQWLLEEGYDGQINDVLYKYWGDLGLAGCFNDKNETWKRG